MHDVREDTCCLLVIDDDEQILSMLHSVFTHFGFQVNCQSDGHGAVDEVRNHPGKYDLILSDFNMPGLNGLQTYHHICEIDPNICFCIMTGGIQELEKNLWLDQGVALVLQKPFTSLRKLADKLRNAWQHHSQYNVKRINEENVGCGS